VDEGESPVRESGDDFVSVLTIHKAKGLEFPVVCLPGLWSSSKKTVGPVVLDREAGRFEVRLNKDLGLSTRGWEEASKRERDVLEAERIRLFYVAMTRARDKLVLPCLFGAGLPPEDAGGARASKGKKKAEDKPSKKAAKILGHFKYMESLLQAVGSGSARWAEVTRVPPKGLDFCREGALRPTGARVRSRRDFATSLDSWRDALAETLRGMSASTPVTSPTALTPPLETAAGAGEEEAGAVASSSSGSGPGADYSAGIGMKVGSLVHSVLESDPGWDGDTMEKLAASLGAELGLPAGAIGHAAGLLRRFSVSEFANRLRGARYIGREVPFCLPMEATVEGVADLVMEEDDGWRVIDFKTDGLSEDEVGERADHYRLQGACYALCLSKILGKPVKEVIFYFLSPQKAHVFEADKPLLDEARAAIAAAAGKS
jgi:ATP-dependent helicase/nuclease subunit A